MPPSIRSVQVVLLAAVCAGAISCHRHTAQAAPPPAAPPPGESAQPAPTAAPGGETGANPALANPIEKSAPAGNPAVAPTLKPVEPKPRPAAPAPAPAPEPVTPKPAPPQITQRISAAEEVELKSQTQKSIAEAEANLRRTSGRQLNDVQRDMVEKIQSFLAQAREASEVPDWSRARILADKARILSVELVNSL
jgi:2-oxoglutarate dehydrogenase E2 component (dihydrolipoamide succinyltransferase)